MSRRTSIKSSSRRKTRKSSSGLSSVLVVILAVAVLYLIMRQRQTQKRLTTGESGDAGLVPIGKQYKNKETWSFAWNPDKSLKGITIERNATET